MAAGNPKAKNITSHLIPNIRRREGSETTHTSLILPFMAKAPDEKQDLPYSAELACVVCTAENQRKKTSFLREKSERLVFLSKISYPLWLVQVGSYCVLVDGLNSPSQTFQFDEPIHTSGFVEELKRNSVDPQKFVETLESQAKAVKDFVTVVNVGFPSLVAERELLAYFQESFKIATLEETIDEAAIPVDVDAKAATQTGQALANCLRTFSAEARGLQIGIDTLEEEAEFHQNAANNEIEQLKEKCDSETFALKPAVDKNVKRLLQKADKILSAMQKKADKKAAVFEKRRENFLRRLQVVERRKEAVQQRIEVAKKKKRSRASSGFFALKKYERDIDILKKEVQALTEEAEGLRKTEAGNLKLRQEEFDKAVALEEAKLSRIQDACQAKIVVQQKRISSISLQVVAISSALESQVGELKRRVAALKSQVEIDWKLDGEEPLQVRVPVYITKYVKGDAEERYTFVSPIAFSKDAGVLNGLKKMLSFSPEPKLMALMHPANKTLQETLSTRLQERLLGDAGFRIRLDAVCRTNNLANQSSFAQTLNEGLDEMENRGYMTSEEASGLCKRVMGEIAWP